MKTQKFLKEWNVIVEALGSGKQSILIRPYKTSLKKFFLYPTLSYANNTSYLDSFQEKHISFAKKHSSRSNNKNKINIKYFATVDSVLERSFNNLRLPEKYYIWNRSHIKSYLNGRTPFIWLLRVYKLKQPLTITQIQGPLIFGNLHKEYSYATAEPVLNDDKFFKLSQEIKK